MKSDPCTRADDETRTRDPNLGKVVRYQLRYIRVSRSLGHSYDFSRLPRRRKTSATPRVSAHLVAPTSQPFMASVPIGYAQYSARMAGLGDWRSW